MKSKHTHIWKYVAKIEPSGYLGEPYIRICEAPIPTIPSCGQIETRDGFGNWVKKLDL